MQLEHARVGRCGAVKSNLLARASSGLLHFCSVVSRYNEARTNNFEAIHSFAGFSAATNQGRHSHFTQVFFGGETVADEAVAYFSRHLGHHFANTGKKDFGHSEVA